MVKLSDIFTLQMGKTPARAKSSYWNDGSNSWVSISDLSTFNKYVGKTKETITDLAVVESGIKPVPADTVIMSFKLSLGKTAITVSPVYTNEAIMAFIPNGKYEVDPNYFYHLFSGRDWTKGTNRAVMGVTLNKATLNDIEVSLPAIAEQREIAANLDKVDELIFLRKQQLEQLEELVKARFIELFGDPVRNEKEWSRLTLGDICEIGSSKRVFEKDYVPVGIPFFRTKEIVELSKGNKISTELFITEEHFETLKQAYGVPKKNDLLISAVGTIGTIWIVNGEFEFYFKDGNLIQIKSSENFNSVFMKYLLDELIANYKKEMSTGTAYSALTIAGLKKMLVYDVPLDLQNQFAEFVEQTDKLKFEVKQALEKLETLKKALMQKYFG